MSEQGVVIMAKKTSIYLHSVGSAAYPQACVTNMPFPTNINVIHHPTTVQESHNLLNWASQNVGSTCDGSTYHKKLCV